jgi:hypothetical protein
MAATSISLPVGIRNGKTVLPNRDDDLRRIRDLFDTIPTDAGGTRDSAGFWATQRELLIPQLTGHIVAFQSLQMGLTADGAIDPTGNTLKRMNALSQGGGGGVAVGIQAQAVPVLSAKYPELGLNRTFETANPTSIPGTGPLEPMVGQVSYLRKLVRVDNCSIKWFGVLFKWTDSGGGANFVAKEPHVFFTPSPIQGDYYDGTYDTFSGWTKLWHDYTWAMGRQICLATNDQILVIPFYRTSQHKDLGDFVVNWKEVIEKVITAAIVSIDVMELRSSYTFNTICSSSFSNGWKPHAQFNAAAAASTRYYFDIDGQAARPASNWQPANGIAFRDRPPPHGALNPIGNDIYVGNRWKKFYKYFPDGFRSHSACARYLMYHAVWQYATP